MILANKILFYLKFFVKKTCYYAKYVTSD